MLELIQYIANSRQTTDLRAVHPSSGAKADGIPEGVKENENYAHVVCCVILIMGINLWK